MSLQFISSVIATIGDGLRLRCVLCVFVFVCVCVSACVCVCVCVCACVCMHFLRSSLATSLVCFSIFRHPALCLL